MSQYQQTFDDYHVCARAELSLLVLSKHCCATAGMVDAATASWSSCHMWSVLPGRLVQLGRSLSNACTYLTQMFMPAVAA